MPDAALVRYRSVIADSSRWDGFAFRPDDIVISTPAKCGTTWTQMICALLVFQTSAFEPTLDLISPWLDMLTRTRADVVGDLDAQRHRRFIKTHTPLDGLPYDERVTYLCVGRDPRDVAVSMAHHWRNHDMAAVFRAREAAVGLDDLTGTATLGPAEPPATARDGFWLWADDASPPTEVGSSLAKMLHHLGTFWGVRHRANVVMLHYDDLRSDLEGQMRVLAERVGIGVADDRWPGLVDAATFDRMRGHADRLVPGMTEAVWIDNQQFFHRGTSGQWHDLLDADDLRRYAVRVARLADPDLVAWVHREPLPG